MKKKKKKKEISISHISGYNEPNKGRDVSTLSGETAHVVVLHVLGEEQKASWLVAQVVRQF